MLTSGVKTGVELNNKWHQQRGSRTNDVAGANDNFPLVSIVTIVLNDADHIEETIQSVLSQSYNYKEYIVIDGGSTDGTLDLIQKYDNQIDYWVSEPDGGVYNAINKGIKQCQGSIIKIINSGDTLAPCAIERAIDYFEDTGLGNRQIVRSYINLTALNGDVINVIDDKGASRFYPSILHPSWYVPKKVYEEVGLYCTNFAVAADYEFYQRAYKCGIEFLTIPESMASFRVGGISGSGLRGQHEVFCINCRYQGALIAVYVYSLNIGQRVLNRVKRLWLFITGGEKGGCN